MQQQSNMPLWWVREVVLMEMAAKVTPPGWIYIHAHFDTPEGYNVYLTDRAENWKMVLLPKDEVDDAVNHILGENQLESREV